MTMFTGLEVGGKRTVVCLMDDATRGIAVTVAVFLFAGHRPSRDHQ
jgi:hypothetical protein